MPPTLYHVPRTISSPLVQLVWELGLIDKGAIRVQEMTFAELKSPSHLAINAMGTSPAFQCTHMGLCMWESGAILDYLLEQFDTTYTFHPAPTNQQSTQAELKQRTKYLQLKQFILATVYPFLATMYIHTLTKNGGELDPEYLAAAQQKCHACLGPALNNALKASEGPYLLGEHISAVDLLAAKPLGNAHSMGLLGDFPDLLALLQRVQARPTYKRAYESSLQQLQQQQSLSEQDQDNDPDDEPDELELILVPQRKKR